MRFSIFLSKSFMALLTCDTSIKMHTLIGKGDRLFLIFADEEFEPLTADITIITSKNKITLKQAANGQRISSTSTLCFSTELFRVRTPDCLSTSCARLFIFAIHKPSPVKLCSRLFCLYRSTSRFNWFARLFSAQLYIFEHVIKNIVG